MLPWGVERERVNVAEPGDLGWGLGRAAQDGGCCRSAHAPVSLGHLCASFCCVLSAVTAL